MEAAFFDKEIKNCSCGKKHICSIESVEIGKNVIKKLSPLCDAYQNILLVSDKNTFKACGAKVYDLLKSKVYCNLILEAQKDVVIPNEEKLIETKSAVNEKTDLIIGVGSGVINDICKYVSYKNNLPYFIVATAPSMDGYASVGAALILDGMKVTVNSAPPKAIIADTDVLKNAPLEMLQAGYGDIIGKYSCLNDWKLSALVNGEYFCQKVYDMTYACAEKVKLIGEKIKERDEESIGELMKALVAVGFAMSYVDSSRPASGSEHHLSHFFEITGILDNKEYFAHGIDVVFSSVITAKIREKLINQTPQTIKFDKEKWKNEIKRIYGACAEEVIKLQQKFGQYEKDDRAVVIRKWQEITEILKEAPSSDEFLEMINKSGLCFDEFEKLYGKEKIEDSVLYAKDLKDRYSVLWLNYMYGK